MLSKMTTASTILLTYFFIFCAIFPPSSILMFRPWYFWSKIKSFSAMSDVLANPFSIFSKRFLWTSWQVFGLTLDSSIVSEVCCAGLVAGYNWTTVFLKVLSAYTNDQQMTPLPNPFIPIHVDYPNEIHPHSWNGLVALLLDVVAMVTYSSMWLINHVQQIHA